jgi:BirA family transcriptional regulator, biotin operon repressor / biotin---[acetyl-CoA-carboxylase] ligase
MLDRLQPGIIKEAVIEKNNLDIDIIVHQTISSTNSWSLQQCKSGRVLPFASFAEQQTQGRGRRGKQWVMSPNSNIAMSLSWRFAVESMQFHLLPLSVAMAIVATLEDLGLEHVQVKWPNDVMVQGKKIAGILIETQPIDRDEFAVVVGVGLNYKMPVKKILKQEGMAVFSEITDVEREISSQGVCRLTDRTDTAISLLQSVIDVMQNYLSEPERYLDKFRAQYDYCKNKEVELILDNGEILSGVALGVDDSAELLVMIDGKQQVFNSAEVSVKTL